jgi:hypothetical protein
MSCSGSITRGVMCVAAMGMMLALPKPARSQEPVVPATPGSSASAVRTLLPATRWVRTPVADPFAQRISVALQSTNLLATQGPERPAFMLENADAAAREVVAAIGLGVVFPLVRLSEWEGGGVMLVADARVFARFRIEYESRDDMGQDWFVGGGIEARDGAWSGRAAIIHRSSHIGDEFAANTGAERIEFGSEQLDLLAAYDLPAGTRVYAGGSWIFRSYLGWDARLRALGVRDRGLVQVGADREWRPWSDPRFALWAGFDVQAAERTEWDAGYSAAAGFGIDTGRSLRVMFRFYDGPSTMGEFFLTPERFYALELVAEI